MLEPVGHSGHEKTRPVLIVGGGIAGLSFALCLQTANIPYILLEAHSTLDPQVGASIGILPNGARLLDQLGCFDHLAKHTVSMKGSATRRMDGSRIGGPDDALRVLEKRTGYPIFFLDRQLLLRELAARIEDRARVLLNKLVVKVDQFADKAVVYCDDGSTYEGDFVVAADGVHSPVRQEMWRHADAAGQGQDFKEDRKAMSSEYCCLFGISSAIPGLNPGQTDRTYAKDVSTLSYVGKAGRIFWFVFAKMDRVYFPPNIPRFNASDAAAMVDRIGDLAIREKGSVTVRDLYSARVACNLVAVEEAQYNHWHFGRLVCLGDSAHKMTPNLGAGASSALESAAELSNAIVPLLDLTARAKRSPTLSEIDATLQKYHDSRKLRATRASLASNKLTRVQALSERKHYINTHYLAPLAADWASEMFTGFIIGAPKVNHLPLPERSIQGSMPFNPKQGWGFEESKVSRARRALPLALYLLHGLARLSRVNVLSQSAPVQLAQDAFGFGMYGIWLLEAARLSNKGTLAQLSLLFGLASQYLGIDVIAPLYFFMLYLQTPVEKFRAEDNRFTDRSYSSSIGVLIFLFSLLQACKNYIPEQFRAIWYIVMSYHPFFISAVQYVLARGLMSDTTRHDRLAAGRGDVPWVRLSASLLMVASAVYRMQSVILTNTVDVGALAELCRSELQFAVVVVIWLALVFHDFREAGMVKSSWTKACFLAISVFVSLGPGGMLAAVWLWREEILLARKHKDAVMKQGFKGEMDGEAIPSVMLRVLP